MSHCTYIVCLGLGFSVHETIVLYVVLKISINSGHFNYIFISFVLTALPMLSSAALINKIHFLDLFQHLIIGYTMVQTLTDLVP